MNEKVKSVLKWVGFALSLYQIAIGLFGTPTSLLHRPLSAGILMFFLFVSVDANGKRGNNPKWYDWVLAFATLACCAYAILNANWFLSRFPYLTQVKVSEYIYGILMVLLVLEAGRRSMGWVMPSLAVLLIAYALFGHLLEGTLWHSKLSLGNLIEQLVMTTEGIWGSPTHAAVTVVFMFVLFGATLNATGTGEFFMDLSLCLTGRFSGATAKTAVVSSGLMGMIQGSSISNVVTTGTFTIPAMKKAGFPDYFAGAVETVASCGGQIMPPVMGAAAFIMADYTGIRYSNIIKYAIIPALLYYTCTMLQVHFRSKKLGMKGLPREEIPSFWKILKSKGVFLIPIVLIIVLLMNGYTAMRAGFIAIVTNFVLAMVFSKDRKSVLKKLLHQLQDAPQQMGTVIAAVTNAGIIIGVLFMTGLGTHFSALVVALSGGKLIIGLILAMFAAIILGMGMPTSGAYIVMATLIAPGLVELGLSQIQAHMFVLYFACMSMLTPPVAIAAYAAAGIAKANPSKVGFTAWRLALAAFIVPYMFAFGPELLLTGTFAESLLPFITAMIGCFCLAAALEGYLMTRVSVLCRILLGAAAILLIHTSLITDAIGIATVAAVVIIQRMKSKRQSGSPLPQS